MEEIKNLNFQPNSLIGRIYTLYLQNKTEVDIAKEIGRDLVFTHNRILVIKRMERKITKQQPQPIVSVDKESIDINKTNENNESNIDEKEVDENCSENKGMKYFNMNKFIPFRESKYIPRRISKTSDLEILMTAYNNRNNYIDPVNILLIGETGTGKTHLLRYFCYKNKLPYARVNLNGGTTADELIGHWIPDEKGGFRWQDGLLTTFVRYGGVIVLDEVNACPAEITFALHPLLDRGRKLTLIDKDNEIVMAHPNFFCIGTMNPDYEGTRPLNEAFSERFKIKLYFDYDKRVEKRLIEDESILELAKKIRLMQKKGEISSNVSTRMLIYYVENMNIFNEKVAQDIFLNNFDFNEREPIKNVFEMLSKEGQIISQEEKVEEEEKAEEEEDD